MGIKEEIFEEFFSSLQEEKEIPESVVIELKQLKESGRITEGNILEVVKKGCEDVGQIKET